MKVGFVYFWVCRVNCNLQAMEGKFEFMEKHLFNGTYLSGDAPSIADISISCSLYVPTFVGFSFCPDSNLKLLRNRTRINNVSEYPKITAFREKMSTFANNEELSAQIAAIMEAMMAAEEKKE